MNKNTSNPKYTLEGVRRFINKIHGTDYRQAELTDTAEIRLFDGPNTEGDFHISLDECEGLPSECGDY